MYNRSVVPDEWASLRGTVKIKKVNTFMNIVLIIFFTSEGIKNDQEPYETEYSHDNFIIHSRSSVPQAFMYKPLIPFK